MDIPELPSGHLAWWLGGAVLVLLLLLAPRWRRASHRSGDAKTGMSRLKADGGGETARPQATPVNVPPAVPEPAPAGDEETSIPYAVDDVEMDHAMRLEVARVYIELDDHAGAQALLQQVIEDGDEVERETAEAMRRDLGSRPKAARSVDSRPADAVAEPPADEAPARDAENLLDLATAYVEIGDAELARLTVAQIEAVGSEAQRRQARALLERLSG